MSDSATCGKDFSMILAGMYWGNLGS